MSLPYSSMIVCINENLKIWVKPQKRRFKFLYYFLCASVSGIVASVFTNPMDVIKTRLQTQNVAPGIQCENASQIKYRNFKSTALQIFKQEGLRGFVKGMLPRAMQASMSSALSWVSYEFVKHTLLNKI